MRDHRSQGSDAENPHPATAFRSPSPNGENDRQQTDELGDHAMTVLPLNAANHVGHLVDGSESCRPIRHGKTGIVAGHQGPGNNQNESRAGGEHGEYMVCAIVGCSEALQKLLLANLVSKL